MILRRLIGLIRDLSEIQCSRTEAWRRIARLSIESTEPKPNSSALARLATALKTSSIHPKAYL